MGAIIAIGLDIAKSVFQIHGAHPANPVIVYRQRKHHHVMTFTQKLLTCVMGIEAYATSRHQPHELKARFPKFSRLGAN